MGRNILLILSCAATPLIPLSVAAQPAWDREKGNCEVLFQTPNEAPLGDLQRCAGLWEAYRDVSRLDESKRQSAAASFQRLYREGDPGARHLAKAALGRLGFAPEAEDPNAPKKAVETRRKKYRALTASEEDRKAALELRKKGMALYGKKQWRAAVEVFNDALARDPASSQLLYDAACSYALARDVPDAVEYLMRLADLATPDAIAKLKKARTDKDFDGMRDEPGYKRATGYAKVKVLNGMPAADKDLGEESVYKLAETIQNPKLGWKVEVAGDDKHSRDRPHVWFKDHSKVQAYILMKLLGHPRVRLVPIDWDTPWDLIVSWADGVETVDGEKVSRHSFSKKDKNGNDPGKRLDEAMKSQDDALAKPDDYVAKADQVLSQPQQSVDTAKKAIDQVKGLTDTAKGAVDAVKGLGNIKW